MATGWAHEGAVLDQIHDTITDGVQNARARLPHGDPVLDCVECGDEIPQKRRDARVEHSMINRRGSKDSQLK